jgi:hypothetical protein
VAFNCLNSTNENIDRLYDAFVRISSSNATNYEKQETFKLEVLELAKRSNLLEIGFLKNKKGIKVADMLAAFGASVLAQASHLKYMKMCDFVNAKKIPVGFVDSRSQLFKEQLMINYGVVNLLQHLGGGAVDSGIACNILKFVMDNKMGCFAVVGCNHVDGIATFIEKTTGVSCRIVVPYNKNCIASQKVQKINDLVTYANNSSSGTQTFSQDLKIMEDSVKKYVELANTNKNVKVIEFRDENPVTDVNTVLGELLAPYADNPNKAQSEIKKVTKITQM